MPSAAQIAWAAGLFEGEGCVRLHRRRNTGKYTRRPQPLLCMSLTDHDVLKRFVRIVGGGRINGPYQDKRSARKPIWHWTWCGRSALVWARQHFTTWLGSRRRAQLVAVIREDSVSPYTSVERRRRAHGTTRLTMRFCNGCTRDKPRKHFSPGASKCKRCVAQIKQRKEKHA